MVSLKPSGEDHALIFANRHLIHEYSGTAAVAFQAHPRRTLFPRDLVTWKSTGVRHILEDIVGESRSKWANVALSTNEIWAT
ncbi:hypothetical protein TNCV_672421 [Trichonephila clavipes]|nr:hypothetical protein TNCV_672421 [Trichonephila clavipes]